MAETMAALEGARKAGLIRHVGVCNFGVEDLKEIQAAAEEVGAPPIVSNQVCYSPLWRALEAQVVPYCVAQQISILPWGPLAQGVLTGKFPTVDDVPPGRARTRLFSKQREFQRHGEEGFEAEMQGVVDELKAISEAESPPMPMANVALGTYIRIPAQL